MTDYNAMFGTHFDDQTAAAYTENVVNRLARTLDDDRTLDIVIVVGQLLTGLTHRC